MAISEVCIRDGAWYDGGGVVSLTWRSTNAPLTMNPIEPKIGATSSHLALAMLSTRASGSEDLKSNDRRAVWPRVARCECG